MVGEHHLLVACCQNFIGLPAVDHLWGQVEYSRMMMARVVAGEEAAAEAQGVVVEAEALRELRLVLQRLELGL